MRKKLIDILLNNLDVELHANIPFDNEILSNWDSIKKLMIISDVESEFNVSFIPDEIEEINDLETLLRLLKNKKENNGK